MLLMGDSYPYHYYRMKSYHDVSIQSNNGSNTMNTSDNSSIYYPTPHPTIAYNNGSNAMNTSDNSSIYYPTPYPTIQPSSLNPTLSLEVALNPYMISGLNEDGTDQISSFYAGYNIGRKGLLCFGTTLPAGSFIFSEDEMIVLGFHYSGNLVLHYLNNETLTHGNLTYYGYVLTETETTGAALDGTLFFSESGNLMILNSNDTVVWESDTSCSRCILKVENNGNFVMYNSTGHAHWATGTNEVPRVNADTSFDMCEPHAQTHFPTSSPSTGAPTTPTAQPTFHPTVEPSPYPTVFPTPNPTLAPTYFNNNNQYFRFKYKCCMAVNNYPTTAPTPVPSVPAPTSFAPSPVPSINGTVAPTSTPTMSPTFMEHENGIDYLIDYQTDLTQDGNVSAGDRGACWNKTFHLL